MFLSSLLLLLLDCLLICAADLDSPRCGFVTHVKFDIINQDLVDFTSSEAEYTANVTFMRIRRKFEDADYHIALIGRAVELNNDFGCLFGMQEVLMRSTNCLAMDASGHCLATTGDSLLVPKLKIGHRYGIILCAILNPENRQLPDIRYGENEMPPFRVDLIYTPLVRNAIKLVSREGCIIFLAAAIIDLIFLFVAMFFCRCWYLRRSLKKQPIRGQTVV